MRSTKILLLAAFCVGMIQFGYSQRAKDGNLTVSTTNNIVNTYTYLTANASVSDVSITVNNNAMAGGIFGGNLAPGDLIMIIQMQGARMNNDTQFSPTYSVPNGFTWTNDWKDHIEAWGSPNDPNPAWAGYDNSGKYEQVEVLSVSGGNTINLQCGLENDYTVTGHVQIVRVPRFDNLTITGGASAIIPTMWNGQTGGVVAIEVDQVLDINAGSTISASGYGFRGGQVDNVGQSGTTGNLNGVTYLGTDNPVEGSEKGEGIFGFYSEYDAIWARYGIAAACNGGGGGGYQNAGGGGGSNVYQYTGAEYYTGNGVPDPAFNAAWALDFSHPPNPNPSLGGPNLVVFGSLNGTFSPGGGRGGYTLADTDQNELVVGPRTASWGGDARKTNGGRGGHPLTYDASRLFFGGGGGAGDQDSGEGGSGGRGGGIVYITNYGSITGSGTVEANGAAGENSNPTGAAPSGGNPVRGEDGAGGGGAGGSIFIENATALPASINLLARGGDGGDMDLSLLFPGFNPDEASGPGGSGTGGSIAYNSGAPTETVTAGTGGWVNSNDGTPMVANFRPNGATDGSPGLSGLSAPYYDLDSNGTTICAGNTANVSVTVLGTLPGGSSVEWYTQQFGGASVNTGLTYTTPVLATTTTYYVGVCPGTFRVPVIVVVNPLDDASFSYAAATYCTSDPDPTPTITGLAGGTFTSAPAGLSINASTGVIDVSASTPGGPYTVTYTTNGPCPNSATFDVTISALDDASFSYASASYCTSEADPTPTITGEPGGTFSAPAGLSINASTGVIDLSASTPGGPYTVTYTTTAPCANSSTFDITITALDDASFSYASATYCTSEPDPTPTITGEPGGTFTAPAGLSINASTGVIDVSASTPGGPYTVTYTTTAPCANSATFDVTITALDDASFSYASATYCTSDADPTPTITGEPGGTFSAPAGLSINASTGVIDVSASTIGGPYTVTYTTTAPCANSSTFDVTITGLDDASFSYTSATYCTNDTDPTPTITGESGGTFSAPAGLSINASTGVIDVSASTPGGPYTVTYTTTAPCANSSTFDVTINALDDASFSYSAAAYCANDIDPTPTITGLAGGGFTSVPAGLSINAASGVIDVSASTPGAYTVTYTTTGACPNSSNVAVTINAVQDASFTMTATCVGGTATITGTPGGSFAFNPAPGDGAVVNNLTGAVTNGTLGNTYFVEYTTPGPCPASLIVSVTAATDLAYVATITDENCGAGDGVIDLVASGGDGGPYQYSITGGAPYTNPGNFTGLSASTYNISILDNSGCEVTGTESVSSTGGPSIDNVAITDPTCAGDCDGSITITVSGGTPPYTYQWYDVGMNPIGTNSPTLSGQCAGDYSVEVTDAAGGGGVFFLEDFGTDVGCANRNQLATTAVLVNGAWTQTIMAAEGGVPNQWFVSPTEAFTGAGNCGDGCIGNAALDNQTLHVGSLGVGLCPAGDCGAAYNAGANGETHKKIESPIINCTGQTGITVSFDYMHFGELGSDEATLSYFDGIGWTNLVPLPQTACCGGPCGGLGTQGQWSPTQYSIILPASANNNPSVRIGFTWDNDANNSGADPSFAVDNIELSTAASVGCPAYANATLTDPPALTITGNTPICVNGTVALTGSGTPDPTTPWASSTPAVATIDNAGLVTGVSGGTTTITYMDDNGCTQTEVVTVNPLDDASFNYGAAAYCTSDPDPTPTITGLAGGGFTSSPAGLSMNGATGAIDVSASTPGAYTITYTTTGTCPNSSNVAVTINALDDATFNYAAAAYCVNDVDPTPTITGLAGGAFTSAPAGLSINGATGVIDVSASTPGAYTITYTTTGTCPNSSNVAVTINALDDASFNYSAAAYCTSDPDPTPTITGLAGGAFTSAPAGLSINGATGVIDVSASTPGAYTITYTTVGTCPNSSNVAVTISTLDDASFSYGAASYCTNDPDPSPTITGLAGGTFTSAPAGLSINGATGDIDVSASTAGVYTVTYTTAGTCPNSSNVSVTITTLDDASFSYGAAAYCANDVDPSPTITGVAGGAFTSSPAGLSINSTTGDIDVSASTPGAYTITYTTTGACSNSSNVAVTINALDDASFSYGAAAYCINDPDPSPTITGLAGGTFTSSPAGLSINGATGDIDVSASTPGAYTVTYTTAGACPNSSNVAVTITALDDASFNYGAAAYCANDVDPTPTITGVAGGAFTSSPAGLSINGTTGAIDVSASTPGAYTVTYTTAGVCANSSNVAVTINAMDDASYSYSAAAYCVGDLDQTPTITGLAGGAFTSSPAGLSINSATGIINVTASTPGAYTVTYTTAGACPNTSDVAVTINALDDATFNYGAALYCDDATDPTPTISGLTGGAFTSAPAGLSINGATGAIDVSASTPGAYTVTYTTTGACPNSSNVAVTVAASPTLTVTDPAGVCAPGTVDLTAAAVTTGSSVGTLTYWTNPGATTTMTTPGAAGTGTYYIQLEDGNLCTSIQPVNAVVNALPNATASNNGPVCSGTSFTLDETAGDATSWSWASSGGAVITANTDQAPTVSGAVDGETFTVTVTDGNGCTNTANTTVSIIAQPAIDPIADVTVCDAYYLPAITGTNLTGNESFYDDTQLNGGNPMAVGTAITSTQTVYMFDGNGSCSNEISFVVTVNPIPTITSLTGEGTYCVGDPIADIMVDVTGTPNWTINYTLDGVAQTATGSTSPISLGNAAGVYTLVDISDANCSGTATGTQTIVINQYPIEPIAGTDETYCSTAVFSDMTATGTGGSFTWYSDAGLTDTLGVGATLTPSNTEGTTTYYVTETTNGCEGPASMVLITVENCEVIIPTAFTPDGDLVNDYWEILYLDNNYPDNIVRVYNRWGSLIFQHEANASNPYSSNMWDGTYQGQPLPVGSYYFIIDFNDGGADPEKGTVSIILN